MSGRSEIGRDEEKSAKQPVAPEQYPFPASYGDAEEQEQPRSPGKRVPQMRTQKARDGGRTQSGGVRGIPADDIEDV